MAEERRVRRVSFTLSDIAVWLAMVRRLKNPPALSVASLVVERADAIGRMSDIPPMTLEEMCDELSVKRRTLQYGLKALETNHLLNRRMVGGLPGQGSQRANILEPLIPEDDEEELSTVEIERGLIAPARAGPEKKGPEGRDPPAAPGKPGDAPRQEPQNKRPTGDKNGYHP